METQVLGPKSKIMEEENQVNGVLRHSSLKCLELFVLCWDENKYLICL